MSTDSIIMYEDGTTLVREGMTTFLKKDGTTYEDVLWHYDPACLHELDPNNWSGIKCMKCGGWFCY